ncbi:YgiQ family radical SAM protein [Psychrilyobacter sp.]|uniref:YgiQ family radical SAM protein n=1 Tax=Psychrilyobacter sp. TaxID=2586924 RepID=UPI003018BA53
MFLPTTREEMKRLDWDSLDIILVSGDSYVDSSYNGSTVIGKFLSKYGFKVGIIAQPDIDNNDDIKRLGAPNLYWAISAGCVDSMVANYTATRKRRQKDDFTPGGLNNRRPDRATISYTNLIKRNFKQTPKPIVIGGIEASLRRTVHYDFWTNKLRKSILFNSKADILSYGMGEKSMLELASAIQNGDDHTNIRGICYVAKEPKTGYLELPSFDECKADKHKFIEAFEKFYVNNDHITAVGLSQKQDTRYLIQNPPSIIPSTEEMDEIYGLEYERALHPYYKKMGDVKALETIKHSVTTHRGCYGECNFCAIAVHQGRTITERSIDSIVKEVEDISTMKSFKGYISDLGGPTANMYGIECLKKQKLGACKDIRCLYPKTCKVLDVNHNKQLELLDRVKKVEGVKKVFIASGIRYDLIMDDNKCGSLYLENLVKDHVSGQLKIAPEHTEDEILGLMGKQGKDVLKRFKDAFYKINDRLGKKQFLTYYLIAAHPGCNERHMKDLKNFASHELKVNPEQVQIFTPTPSTYSTLMYYTEIDPFTGKSMKVEKDTARKYKQKDILIDKDARNGYMGNSYNKNHKASKDNIDHANETNNKPNKPKNNKFKGTNKFKKN